MSRRKRPATKKRIPWVKMTQGMLNPAYFNAAYDQQVPEGVNEITFDGCRYTVWGNGTFEATYEEDLDTGMGYITIKRNDRQPIRDWRQLQSIKNEVAGPEREAFELFPAESRLMDTANQYHLYVLPEGEPFIGQQYRQVMTPEELRATMPPTSKARQRDWQPGLSTGPDAVSE